MQKSVWRKLLLLTLTPRDGNISQPQIQQKHRMSVQVRVVAMSGVE